VRVHVVGMGLIGCAVARSLLDLGVHVSWEDADAPHTAWKASTGAVYPSPHSRDAEAYKLWSNWRLKHMRVDFADYWYCTKNAPHGYKAAAVAEVGPLKLHPEPSLHLNVQDFVRCTRVELADLRTQMSGKPEGSVEVVAHGFNYRLRRYVWGWTQWVGLDYSRLAEHTRLPKTLNWKPCVYLRDGMTTLAYAYPCPGTPYWYAGSSLIVQQEPRERNPEKVVARWKSEWDRLTGGVIPICATSGPVIQGWRPSTGPVEDEEGLPFWSRAEEGGPLTVMPLWHSGVRWLPLVVRELTKELDL